MAEIPDEITLAINISGCKFNCGGCHSPYLRGDSGEYLTTGTVVDLLEIHEGVSCIAFMGGDHETEAINVLASNTKFLFPYMKVAWYSGAEYIPDSIDLENFDYIKIGPYRKDKGPLDNPNTNQKLFKIEDKKLEDITHRFWKV